MGIRDGKNSDPGSWMENSRIRDLSFKNIGFVIRDKHPGSAILVIGEDTKLGRGVGPNVNFVGPEA
jgi:hypothetical protein